MVDVVTNTPRAGESAEQTAARSAESRAEHRIAERHTIPPYAMRRVIVESPFAGDVEANLTYLRACLHDCLMRGEAPFASHALYTQPGVLDDEIEVERVHGINAGFAWLYAAQGVVVYTDRGISNGMKLGISNAEFHKMPIEYRSLPGWKGSR